MKGQLIFLILKLQIFLFLYLNSEKTSFEKYLTLQNNSVQKQASTFYLIFCKWEFPSMDFPWEREWATYDEKSCVFTYLPFSVLNFPRK